MFNGDYTKIKEWGIVWSSQRGSLHNLYKEEVPLRELGGGDVFNKDFYTFEHRMLDLALAGWPPRKKTWKRNWSQKDSRQCLVWPNFVDPLSVLIIIVKSKQYFVKLC